MVYTFSSSTPWWRHLAAGLRFATETTVVSDLPEADVYIIPAFYRHLHTGGCDDVALRELGPDVCNDVIARCRLLRHLERSQAMAMIGAMWQTIEELLDRYQPELFICFLIDRYILDLAERALARRGVRYVGLAVGIPPDYVMFMARGEHLPVREPDEAEVDRIVAALTRSDFRPTYVATNRFTYRRFLRLWAKFTARWLVFEFLMVWRRNPLDFRYVATRWARCGYRVRLRDWRVMSFFRPDWRTVFEQTPFEDRVFIGLSVNPEAAIEYWVRDRSLVDYADVLDRVAASFGRAGLRLFVKDHPSQFGFRQFELFDRLARHDCVTFVPYDVSGREMIDKCHTTFTWTGTVGFEAAMIGRAVIAEEGAYYLIDDAFLVMRSLADIDAMPARIRAFRAPNDLQDLQRRLVRILLRATVPGSYMAFRDFHPDDAAAVAATASLVDSFNRYLPQLATRRVPPARADGGFYDPRHLRSVDDPPAAAADRREA